jgi:hypothetical protein
VYGTFFTRHASRQENVMNEPALAAIEGESLQGMMQPQPLARGADPSSGIDVGASSGGSGFGKTAIAAIALLVLGGVAVGLLPMPGFGPSQSTAPVPVAIEQPLTQPDAGPGLIRPVLAGELQQAIDGMLISEGEKAHLRTDLASGKTRIGWLSVSDSEAEDGDWVTVSAVGLSQDVRLFHKPTTLAVAYTPGTPVVVTGKIDGDGKGITVAVHVNGSTYPLAPMRIGTSVQVPAP